MNSCFFFIDFSTSNSKQSDKCRLFDLLTIKPTILFDIINLWPFLLHSIRWFEDLSKHSDPTDFPELKKKKQQKSHKPTDTARGH